MKFTSKVRLTFGLMLLLALATGYITYPKSPNIQIGSWHRDLNLRLGLDLQGGVHLEYQANLDTIAAESRQEAIDAARDVIERRVNLFGVSEAVVQTAKVGEQYRIIVELPGVFDTQEAIKLIGDTPTLDFREEKADANNPPVTEDIAAYNEDAKKRAETVLAEAVKPGADFAALANQYTEDQGNVDTNNNKLGGELGFATKGAYVTEFDDVLFGKMSDNQVYPELVQTVFGYHIIYRETSQTNDKGELEVKARHILIRTRSENDVANQLANYQTTGLNGQHLKTAMVQFDQNTSEPVVALTFNDEGKKLFAEITERNLNKPVAIFLDDSPISVPIVNQVISTGEAIISGNFSLPEAKTLARRLNAGALPVPLELISQQTLGATLGKTSVERSLFAGVVGLVVVALFMIFIYRLPGLLAVLALIIYTLIVMSIFKLWPVTMTLAGVAGFILSIGMAVDANILIFERLREELRAGRPLAQAIEEGFSRAWPSIRDSNVSSLITTTILYVFSTSLIRGFAITLGIGILASMFSAITVTRTFLRLVTGEWLSKHLRLFGVRPEEN